MFIRCATCKGKLEVSPISSNQELDFETHLPASYVLASSLSAIALLPSTIIVVRG